RRSVLRPDPGQERGHSAHLPGADSLSVFQAGPHTGRQREPGVLALEPARPGGRRAPPGRPAGVGRPCEALRGGGQVHPRRRGGAGVGGVHTARGAGSV
ncbi:unnamed protein product, partial [Prorocentrum cordatum]